MELEYVQAVLGIAVGICVIIGTLIKILDYFDRHQ